MRIHDKYILSGFWRNILLGLLAFSIIYVTVDVTEQIDKIIDNDARVIDVVIYYIYALPWIILLITPVAVLLAAIFTLGKLSRDNELTAFISSGTSMVRVAVPILVSATLISLFSIAFDDIVVPVSKRRAEKIMQVDIRKEKKKSSTRYKNDMHYQGDNNITYYAERYDISMGVMVNVIIQEYDGTKLVRRIDARKAFWDGVKWVFLDGAVRDFKEAGETITSFSRMNMDWIKEKPEDLAKEDIEPEEMNLSQLTDYIDKVRRAGRPVDKYMVDFYFRFSFPFTSLIFALIGVALSSAKRKPSMATGFGMTLLISFTYYGVLRIGQALGHSGVIPPFLSAWAGNIIFLAVGWVLLYRANR